MKKLLIVVDMQKDFLLSDGKLNLGHDTEKLRKDVGEFVKNFEGDVILTQDTHQKDSCEFAMFPEHCIENSSGWDIVDEIAVDDSEKFTFIEKSSFTSKEVIFGYDRLSIQNVYSEIHVVGICIHICLHDIIAAIVNHCKNCYNEIPKVIVHKNLIDDFNPEMADFALKRMQNLYGVTLI